MTLDLENMDQNSCSTLPAVLKVRLDALEKLTMTMFTETGLRQDVRLAAMEKATDETKNLQAQYNRDHNDLARKHSAEIKEMISRERYDADTANQTQQFEAIRKLQDIQLGHRDGVSSVTVVLIALGVAVFTAVTTALMVHFLK